MPCPRLQARWSMTGIKPMMFSQRMSDTIKPWDHTAHCIKAHFTGNFPGLLLQLSPVAALNKIHDHVFLKVRVKCLVQGHSMGSGETWIHNLQNTVRHPTITHRSQEEDWGKRTMIVSPTFFFLFNNFLFIYKWTRRPRTSILLRFLQDS
jgi:hypothetical protein